MIYCHILSKRVSLGKTSYNKFFKADTIQPKKAHDQNSENQNENSEGQEIGKI